MIVYVRFIVLGTEIQQRLAFKIDDLRELLLCFWVFIELEEHMDFHLLQIKSDILHLYNSHWLINGGFHILKLGIRTPLPLIFVDGYSFILDIWKVNKTQFY